MPSDNQIPRTNKPSSQKHKGANNAPTQSNASDVQIEPRENTNSKPLKQTTQPVTDNNLQKELEESTRKFTEKELTVSQRVHSIEDTRQSLRPMSWLGIKRQVDADLYEMTPSTKRMKPCPESSKSTLSDTNFAAHREYYSCFHNEILTVAGNAGLINPLHFEVSDAGTIGIAAAGLKEIELYKKKQDIQTIRADGWKERFQTEINDKIRKIMSSADFFTRGHPSLAALVEGLKNGGVMSPGELAEIIKDVNLQTAARLIELNKWVDRSRYSRELLSVEETLEIRQTLQELYGAYKDRTLESTLEIHFSTPDRGWRRVSLTRRFQKIAYYYSNLALAGIQAGQEGKVPVH